MDATPFLDKARLNGAHMPISSSKNKDDDEEALVASTAAMEEGGGGGVVNHGRGGTGIPMAGPVVEDEPEVKTVAEGWSIFLMESKKLWKIAVPIAFNVLCLYGMNSTTQIFVGHIGNLELSAVAIGLSVVANFSFGFLVSQFQFSLAAYFTADYI